MPIDYDAAMKIGVKGAPSAYSREAAMLYALGLGFGRDPLDLQELRFVFEKKLVAVPTIATLLAAAGNAAMGELNINLNMLLHGEQGMEFHQPMPASADTIIDQRVVDIFDKGEGKGAVILIETAARMKDTGAPLVTQVTTLFARGDGGFMKPGQTSKSEQPRAHQIPDRAPDMVDEFQTRPDQALLYRLSGDYNPLHADPAFAARAGFDRPILHGLCTYGICCRAVLKHVVDYDASRIGKFNARFSSPVLPGETIVTELWKDGDQVSFRASVRERNLVAVNNGFCHIVESRA
jgi:acyl dehydratase